MLRQVFVPQVINTSAKAAERLLASLDDPILAQAFRAPDLEHRRHCVNDQGILDAPNGQSSCSFSVPGGSVSPCGRSDAARPPSRPSHIVLASGSRSLVSPDPMQPQVLPASPASLPGGHLGHKENERHNAISCRSEAESHASILGLSSADLMAPQMDTKAAVSSEASSR